MARAIYSGTISFGLVVIPIKFYTAAKENKISFNYLHKTCKSRIKMQYHCATDDEVINKDDLIKGYEFAKNQYVTFTAEEIEKLDAERSNSIEIVEFVPLNSIDPLQIQGSYYIGANKGGDKAYRLLCETLKETNKVAIGKWTPRGKDQLVMIRGYKDGLLVHTLYYPEEIRAFEHGAANIKINQNELDLAKKLVGQLSANKFDAQKYHDEYAQRIAKIVEEKCAGKTITVLPAGPTATVNDLMDALKNSLNKSPTVEKNTRRNSNKTAKHSKIAHHG